MSHRRPHAARRDGASGRDWAEDEHLGYHRPAMERQIEYVSDEHGETTAVLVPIDLWREITSERETAYLLRSETMKRRHAAGRAVLLEGPRQPRA